MDGRIRRNLYTQKIERAARGKKRKTSVIINLMSDHRVILDEHRGLDLLLRDLRVVCTWKTSLLQQETALIQEVFSI